MVRLSFLAIVWFTIFQSDMSLTDKNWLSTRRLVLPAITLPWEEFCVFWWEQEVKCTWLKTVLYRQNFTSTESQKFGKWEQINGCSLTLCLFNKVVHNNRLSRRLYTDELFPLRNPIINKWSLLIICCPGDKHVSEYNRFLTGKDLMVRNDLIWIFREREISVWVCLCV